MGEVFSEIIIAPGTILYKGLPVPCDTLLKDLRSFYLTDDPKYAGEYGKACSYRVKKTLRLFEMTHENIKKVLALPDLKPQTKARLRLAFGTGITVREQLNALIKEKKAKNIPKNLKNLNQPGQRASWANLNKMMNIFFSQEFLIKRGYDGYYAEAKKTIFHRGMFRSEIMLVNAYQKIERAEDRMPVASQRTMVFPQTVARLFLEYSKKNKRLVRPTRGFTVFCTGGQAVNLYLRQRSASAKIPQMIRRTTDFDFSFAVSKEIKSQKELTIKGDAMRNFMLEHMKGFVAFINKNYKGVNAKFRMKRGRKTLHPDVQVPATRRRTYLVHTWQLLIGKKVVDVADAALAFYPGVNRTWLSDRFSRSTGIPIQKLKYQFINSLALLSGSLIHKSSQVAKRNPFKTEKGKKNSVRANQLAQVVTRYEKNYPNLVPAARSTLDLLSKIKSGRVKNAESKARVVNALIKNLVQ